MPPQQYDGAEQVIYHLINELKAAGHEPILLGAGDPTANCETIPIVDEAIHLAKYKQDLKDHERPVAEAGHKAHKYLRELLPSIDIIHSHGFVLKRFRDFPNVTTLPGTMTLRNLDYYLRRRDLYYVSISKKTSKPFAPSCTAWASSITMKTRTISRSSPNQKNISVSWAGLTATRIRT